MLIMHEAILNKLMSDIVNAAISCVDHNGQRPIIGTIDAKALRGSALAAISSATGFAVDTEVPKFTKAA